MGEITVLGIILATVLISVPIYPADKVKDAQSLYEWERKEFTYQAEPEGQDYWQTPQETFSKKGGDCDDLAFFNEAVLKQLGYKEVYAIAIKGRDKFFHAICVVKVEGKYRYFSNQYYSYFKSFESIEEIVTFECTNYKWWAEISLPHEIKNFHHLVTSGG